MTQQLNELVSAFKNVQKIIEAINSIMLKTNSPRNKNLLFKQLILKVSSLIQFFANWDGHNLNELNKSKINRSFVLYFLSDAVSYAENNTKIYEEFDSVFPNPEHIQKISTLKDLTNGLKRIDSQILKLISRIDGLKK